MARPIPRDIHLLNAIYRSAGWTRFALLAHALVIDALVLPIAAHPWIVALAMIVMTVWSVMIYRWYTDPAKRTTILAIVDLLVTLAVIAPSRYALGPAVIEESYFGLAAYWMLAAPGMISLMGGALPGAMVGLGVGLVQFVQAPSIAPRAWSDVILVVMICYLVGVVISELAATVAQRDRNFATAVALEERERLNRIVHDGVLQVLAMVAREGSELGPRGKMLAVLARKQEDQLRATLQDRRVDVAQGDFLDADMTDVTIMLEKHQSPTVTVSVMAGEVNMPSSRARELDSAITEVLSNAYKHAGVDARVWVLLEQEGPDLIISVRDDGIGMTPSQLKAAADAGHLGVKESIVGRISDLGGTSTLHSAPGEGTEWEFKVPIHAKVTVSRGDTDE